MKEELIKYLKKNHPERLRLLDIQWGSDYEYIVWRNDATMEQVKLDEKVRIDNGNSIEGVVVRSLDSELRNYLITRIGEYFKENKLIEKTIEFEELSGIIYGILRNDRLLGLMSIYDIILALEDEKLLATIYLEDATIYLQDEKILWEYRILGGQTI